MIPGQGVAGRLKAALADRYRIEREIGSGGMATVYLAHDLKHHRRVAIKVLRKDGRTDDVVLPSEAVVGLEIWFKAMDFRRCRCKCPFELVRLVERYSVGHRAML